MSVNFKWNILFAFVFYLVFFFVFPLFTVWNSNSLISSKKSYLKKTGFNKFELEYRQSRFV